MRTFTPVLNSKGLLAASIAMLSGHALAETAARVAFVSGDVTAKAADGSSRSLKRGDSINGGDRINTNGGRVQLRFTDGGFVALQPGTVFGVDEYVYANRKPEETSLFFNLIQGGMRTITGAIGKVNKKTYQVRTPVATIGIRGTEYRAVVGERGLIVSVGAGFVNVANTRGDITGGAGQNIRVLGLDTQPELGKEEALVLASGVNGDQEEQGATPEEQDGGDERTVGVADIQNVEGDYNFLFTDEGRVSLPNSSPAQGGPTYLMASPNAAAPGSEYYATFDQTGSKTGTVGGLLNLYHYGSSIGPSSSLVYGYINDLRSGTMEVVNSGTIGALTWGEYTDGISAENQALNCIDGCFPLNLSDTSFVPYVVGTAPNGNLGKGTATYTLQGGTPVRDNNGMAGTLDSFEMRVNLDFASVEAKFQLTMPSLQTLPPGTDVTYNVSTVTPVSFFNLGTASHFSLNSSMLSVSDNSGACTSIPSNCYASIDAFFAGDASSQVGASYSVDDYMNYRFMSGVAALGLSSYSSNVVLDSGPGYTLAYAGPTGYAVLGGYTAFDATNYLTLDTSLTNTFDANGNLTTATGKDALANTVTLMDAGATTGTEGGQAGGLKWGRWYNSGTTALPVVTNGIPGTLGAGESLHYVTGSMTQPNFFSAVTAGYGYGATATYTYQGGTTASATDGTTGNVLAGSSLGVTFWSTPQLTLDMNVAMNNGDQYHLGGSTLASVSNTGATFSFIAGSGGTCSGGAAAGSTSGCTANVQGFFAGQQAQQIGLSYQINDFSGRKVTGAAAFGRGAITPNTTPL